MMVAEIVALVDNLSMRKVFPLAFSGILMLFVGIYMIVRPDDFQAVVMAILGIYIVFDGVRSLVSLMRYRSIFSPAVRTIDGIKTVVNIILGLVVILIAFMRPTLLLTVVIYIIASDFLLTGIFNFINCMALSRLGMMFGSLGLEAVLSFLFAIILFMFPGFVGSVVMTLFAAILLASGAVMVFAAVSSLIFQYRLSKMDKGDII